MHLCFSAICEDARPTPEGKIDVHGVYHDLAAPGFPARQDLLVLVLVLEWDREDHGRYLFKADLEDEEGNATVTVEGETEVHRPSPDRPPARSQLIMPLENIVFPRAGRFTFRVTVKGQAFEGPSVHLVTAPEDAEAS